MRLTGILELGEDVDLDKLEGIDATKMRLGTLRTFEVCDKF